MRKLTLALVGFMVMPLVGCVMSPQTIQLNEQVSLQKSTAQHRDALVRVVDEREVGAEVLGTRGGRAPEYSPLLSEKPLADVLTARMQTSLTDLGFGDASGDEPIKVQLTIEKFDYSCNEGLIVHECGIDMRFLVTVIDGNHTFNKPFGINEVRSLAASPMAEYNEKWVNDVLNRLWMYMFNDPELKQALGVR